MAVIEIAKIQVRRGQEHVTGVPQLDPGEFGWAEDTQHLYIGKRIVEGASNDENTRILTDQDLRNIFDVLGGGTTGSAASTSTYRYRDSLDFFYFHSTTTTIAKKLDATVNLQDFSQTALAGDITQVLRTAVADIYANAYYGTDTIRTLIIPAGKYNLSGTVDLPPLVTLVGEGAGLTTLVLNNSGTSMFRTVDKLGAHFEQGMQFDGRASQGVSIENMTLAYNPIYPNNAALVSLDNSINPKIKNVEFTTLSTQSGFTSTGVGISVRGSIGVDESTAIARDIEVIDCKFNILNTAILEDGHVSKTIVTNNEFTNLQQALKLTSTSTIIPCDVSLSKNKFSFIHEEAIYVTTSTNSSRIISSENQYYYVGNQSSASDQNSTSTAKPVMTFLAPGNVSLNDYFNRLDVNTSTNYFINAVANGNVKVINNKPYKKSITANLGNQLVYKFPLTGQDQIVTVEYQLSNTVMSRKGRLIINISSDNFASVSDYYNYSEVTQDESTKLIFSTDDTFSQTKNYITLTVSNFSTYQTNLEFTYDLAV